jgi:hypothetical protein
VTTGETLTALVLVVALQAIAPTRLGAQSTHEGREAELHAWIGKEKRTQPCAVPKTLKLATQGVRDHVACVLTKLALAEVAAGRARAQGFGPRDTAAFRFARAINWFAPDLNGKITSTWQVLLSRGSIRADLVVEFDLDERRIILARFVE